MLIDATVSRTATQLISVAFKVFRGDLKALCFRGVYGGFKEEGRGGLV